MKSLPKSYKIQLSCENCMHCRYVNQIDNQEYYCNFDNSFEKDNEFDKQVKWENLHEVEINGYCDNHCSIILHENCKKLKQYHLMSFNLEHLHSFAKEMGLKREWFQDKYYPHYDIFGENIPIRCIKKGVIYIEQNSNNTRLKNIFKAYFKHWKNKNRKDV